MATVKCILFGDEDGLSLKLGGGDTFACSACDNEFTTDDVRGQVEAWQRMLAWALRCPARQDAEPVEAHP